MPQAHRRTRALTLAGIGVALLLVIGFAGFQLLPGRSPASAGAAKPARVQTATITRTDLASTMNVNGQLGYGPERAVKAGSEGKVTWLPKSGRTVTRGRQLFRVNDQPVMLFYGRTPLFRRLDTVGLVGRDVKVVAGNLRALGYSIGAQPAVGRLIRQQRPPADVAGPTPDAPADAASDAVEPAADPTDPNPGSGKPTPAPSGEPIDGVTSIKVRPGDAVLTESLRSAIKRWQRHIGALPTGVLEIGAVVVEPQSIRIGAVTAQLGDPADGPLISVTKTAKVVSVSIKADEMEAIRGARRVTVTLPSGTTAAGRVSSISRVVATPDGQDQEPGSTATITLDHPSAIQHLDAAPVQVQLTAEARKNVLAVPVGALLALSEGGYALQRESGELIPVTVGLFAKGQVEVSGDGVLEGTAVVTTS